jgi:hypothetical protein
MLSVPVMVLYPLMAQSDLIKAFALEETLGQHLEYLLPPPWDEDGKLGYGKGKEVKAFLHTPTKEVPWKLLQVGKGVKFGEVLGGEKVVVEDGLVRVMVVPSGEVDRWLESWRLRMGGGKKA